MTHKSIQPLLVIIALLLGCIATALLSPSTRGQSTSPGHILAGRYQFVISPTSSQEFIFDTQTGRLWERPSYEPSNKWGLAPLPSFPRP